MTQKDLQPIKQRYGIVGNSGGLNRALDIAIQVAPTDLSVLIEGENGVGKEAIPRIIHDNSSRKHQKYFAINCGSIPEGTIDSELFGHEKGAFTGAIGEHEGYFGAANKGTLFLDEVGELPLSTQVRLLRVLETGEYLRVGSNEVRKTDVRIIAATNVKMKKAISEGRFREDLYFRLATIPISVPPLRDRGDDIVLLFRKFARDIAEKYRLEPIYLTEDAKQLLMLYKWPGNIRQLKNLTEQLSIISPQREITVEMLKEAGITDDSDAQGGLVLLRDTKNTQHTYENEREMLLQQLFNLSKEIQKLKEMVNKSNNFNAQAANYNPQIPNIKQQPTNYNPVPSITDDAEIVNAEEYVEEQPMSIKDIHYQSILDALKRNHFNRKKAAQELGISERTIYRKLKENGYKKE
ncbi:MAG: sigma-54-dependent Fis family transcriptional regulator [Bacteroidaceae bacterium]|nr:sigma-54-dependent Fis family transcriptional regulator [Bacteroidaceae bacterium]